MMTDENGAPICPRCKRGAYGWPVWRGGDRCSPRDWVDCIREPELVMAEREKKGLT